MSQSPTERARESGETSLNTQDNGDAAVSNLETSMRENTHPSASTMVSDGARSGAAQPMVNAGDSTVQFTAENEPSSDGHRRQPPSLPLDTSSPILDDLLARSSRAVPSRPSAGAGPSTRPQSPRANSRKRGYSLRRSLFNKNIQSQPVLDGAIMEMESPGSSCGHPVSSNTTGKGEKGKPSVTVSTFAVDEDSSIPSEYTRFGDTVEKRHFPYGRSSLLQARQELLPKLRRSFQKAKKTLLRMNQISPTANGRSIILDFSDPSIPIDERTGVAYVSKLIRSSRYTLLNFFPRQLLAQFSKLANFYFLTVSILQMIPGLSTTGTYTTIVPLLIFVGISMAKEGYDDIRRWRLDKEENNRDTLVLDHEWHSNSQDKTQWKSTKWRDVKVGDVLLLQRNDPIPADLAILHADDLSGAAYIEVCKIPPITLETLVELPW
jgi:phospholipid-translocating ATPase